MLADVLGYRRIFNKKSVSNWGTKNAPGLTLNLQKSTSIRCCGRAFQFPDDFAHRQEVRQYLHGREGCDPVELPIQLEDGEEVRGLVYVYKGTNVINPEPSLEEKVAMIVVAAKGTHGTGFDYISGLAEGLSKLGINDPAVDELWLAVRERRLA